MKINYRNENYISNIPSIIICIILMIIVFIWGFSNEMFIDVSGIIFFSFFILILLIPIIIFTIRYYKQKQQRNLNLFIMKNGICIEGRIISIYDNFTYRPEIKKKSMHNITAEIAYNIDNEEKTILVDRLYIRTYNIEKYKDKVVKIYIYNNMTYVDVIN